MVKLIDSIEKRFGMGDSPKKEYLPNDKEWMLNSVM